MQMKGQVGDGLWGDRVGWRWATETFRRKADPPRQATWPGRVRRRGSSVLLHGYSIGVGDPPTLYMQGGVGARRRAASAVLTRAPRGGRPRYCPTGLPSGLPTGRTIGRTSGCSLSGRIVGRPQSQNVPPVSHSSTAAGHALGRSSLQLHLGFKQLRSFCRSHRQIRLRSRVLGWSAGFRGCSPGY